VGVVVDRAAVVGGDRVHGVFLVKKNIKCVLKPNL
jgi:hypothetical protein